MANKLTEKAATEELELRVDRDTPLARVQALPWLLLILALAAVAWLTWRAFFYEERADPVGSAMLAFEKQNSLTVFSSRFEVVAESEDSRGVLNIDILNSRQLAVIPAQVEYRIDLGAMDRDRFGWDEDSKTLTVILPPLRVSRPNLDEAKARTFTEGAWVTRDASEDLARNNSRQAESKASTFARNPEIIALARSAAKEAIRQNLAIPMQVAGYGDVTVDVRFDGQVSPE